MKLANIQKAQLLTDTGEKDYSGKRSKRKRKVKVRKDLE